MRINETVFTLISVLAFAQPCIALENRERNTPKDDGEWMQLFWFPVGVSSSHLSVLVPAEDLVISWAFGDGGGFFAARSLGSPQRPVGRPFEGTPPDEFPVGAILDPVRHRILFFTAGFDGQSATETTTWALHLGPTLRWEHLQTRDAPRARPAWSIVFDRLEDRLIFFGGHTRGSGVSDEVCALSLMDLQWTSLAVHGRTPEPRSDHSAIYDPEGQRMVVYGGWSQSGLLEDVWELSLGKQSRWRALRTHARSPGPRWAHAAIFDVVESRMVVFGGAASVDLKPENFRWDVWELSLRGDLTWRELQPRNAPPAVAAAWTGVAYDNVGDQMLVGDISGVSALRWGRTGGQIVAERHQPSVRGHSSSTPTVAHSNGASQDQELKLYDVTGRLVLSRASTSSEDLAEVRRLPRGIYFAHRRDRGGAVTVKRLVVLDR